MGHHPDHMNFCTINSEDNDHDHTHKYISISNASIQGVYEQRGDTHIRPAKSPGAIMSIRSYQQRNYNASYFMVVALEGAWLMGSASR